MNKTRITVLLATNADGNEKLPLYFIGTAKKPQCFRGKPATHYELWYDANKKGWMRSDLFRDWMLRMDKRSRNQQRHVRFLMNNV